MHRLFLVVGRTARSLANMHARRARSHSSGPATHDTESSSESDGADSSDSDTSNSLADDGENGSTRV